MSDGPITTIIVRHSAVGFHHWPDAAGERSYLSARHRHLFKIEVELEVLHNDREVEFHDLLKQVADHFSAKGQEWGACSCEVAAYELASTIRAWLAQADDGMVRVNPPPRSLSVSVFEDGECGARVAWHRKGDNAVHSNT